MTIASNRRIRLAEAALAAGLLMSTAARSDDFTFTVPVNLQSLPSTVIGAGVRCEVFNVVPPPAPAAPGGSRLASGQGGLSLTNGGFQGNVTVHFNASGNVLNDAKGYRCFLYYMNREGREAFAIEWPHRQGTAFNPEARGALNP